MRRVIALACIFKALRSLSVEVFKRFGGRVTILRMIYGRKTKLMCVKMIHWRFEVERQEISRTVETFACRDKNENYPY